MLCSLLCDHFIRRVNEMFREREQGRGGWMERHVIGLPLNPGDLHFQSGGKLLHSLSHNVNIYVMRLNSAPRGGGGSISGLVLQSVIISWF